MSFHPGASPPPAYAEPPSEPLRGDGNFANYGFPRSPYQQSPQANLGQSAGNFEDVYIAVMGSTGAGKSSFIEVCTGQEVGVGHKLVSCTTEVEEFTFIYQNRFQVHLVDTPGFDDTNRSDSEVLRDVASWLGTAYEQDVCLSGIIYLHRISDVRMTGTARRNLQMFKKLCGEECFPKIVLATTFWGVVDQEIGIAREQELVETEGFWGFMTKKGSSVMRHMGDRESAMRILQHIFAQRKEQEDIPLAIQREIVDEGVKLDDTAAGRSIDEELRKQRARYEREIRFMQEEKEEALRAKDLESFEETQKVQREYEEKLAKSMRDSESLKVNLETIQLETARKLKQLQDEVEQARQGFQRRAKQGSNQPRDQQDAEMRDYEAKREEVTRQNKGIYGRLSELYGKGGEWMEKNPVAMKNMMKAGKFATKLALHAIAKSKTDSALQHGSTSSMMRGIGPFPFPTQDLEALFQPPVHKPAVNEPEIASRIPYQDAPTHAGPQHAPPDTVQQGPIEPLTNQLNYFPPPIPAAPPVSLFNPSPGMAKGPNPLGLPTTGKLGTDIILDQWGKQVAWRIGAIWPGPEIWSRFNDPSWPDDLARFVKVRDEQTGVEYWARPFSGTVSGGNWVSWH